MAGLIPQFSTLLPPDVREPLIAASEIKNPRDRAAAVHAATQRARRRYPHLFQPVNKEPQS